MVYGRVQRLRFCKPRAPILQRSPSPVKRGRVRPKRPEEVQALGEQIDRLFDTVNRSSDAFLDAIRFGNERACRFSKMVIEEAARTQREQSDLTKQWMESPVDGIGLTKAAMETWTGRQRRRFELTRTVFDEMAGVRDETRDVVGRVQELSEAVDKAPSGRRRNGRK